MLSVSTQLAPTDDHAHFVTMLNSAAFADEIMVFVYRGVDPQFVSTIQKNSKVKVVNIDPVPLVEHIRTRQIIEAKGDWVLILDFDEVVTPDLKQSLSKILNLESSVYTAYYIHRRNFSLGYPLRHGGWGDDHILRLFHRTDFVAWPPSIHSTPTFKGKTGELTGVLEHHKDISLSYMVGKTNVYSDAEAKLFFAGGMAPVTQLTLLRKSVMEFLRRYFFKLGFLDGRIGLIQSLYQSYSVFLTYSKLYELQLRHYHNLN